MRDSLDYLSPGKAAVHRSPPEPTPVHACTPLPNEGIIAREPDRQRLHITPISILRHTVKKTYGVDTFYVDLIERYAKAEGVELKDVVNLAFHEFFERRDYLPKDTP